MTFKNGFLIRKMNIKNLEYKNIVPTLAELDEFTKGESNEEDKQKLIDKTTSQMNLVYN